MVVSEVWDGPWAASTIYQASSRATATSRRPDPGGRAYPRAAILCAGHIFRLAGTLALPFVDVHFVLSSTIRISSSVRSYSSYTSRSIWRSVASIWRWRTVLSWAVFDHATRLSVAHQVLAHQLPSLIINRCYPNLYLVDIHTHIRYILHERLLSKLDTWLFLLQHLTVAHRRRSFHLIYVADRNVCPTITEDRGPGQARGRAVMENRGSVRVIFSLT